MKPAEAVRASDTLRDSQAGRPISSQAAVASMRDHGIACTADNYTVWHCYLTGSNPSLNRAIDIFLSNGLAIEERALRVLYTRHFCRMGEAIALHDLARRTMRTLSELTALPLTDTGALMRLDQDMRDLVQQSEQMTHLLTQSADRIAQLECFLDDARREASTDGLTGVANRRAFDLALRAKAGDAMNDGNELAFLLVDIDRFKLVNDRWGHPVGDDVLRMVAGTLTRIVRGQDIVARYGGEEFAIILPNTDQHGALAAAENLRSAVEQQALPLADAPSLHVTISAGASCYDHGEKLGAWLARADLALYAAKNGGRNQVVFGAMAAAASNVVPIDTRLHEQEATPGLG